MRIRQVGRIYSSIMSIAGFCSSLCQWIQQLHNTTQLWFTDAPRIQESASPLAVLSLFTKENVLFTSPGRAYAVCHAADRREMFSPKHRPWQRRRIDSRLDSTVCQFATATASSITPVLNLYRVSRRPSQQTVQSVLISNSPPLQSN